MDSPSSFNVDILAAMESVTYSAASDAGAPLGFDLDGVCVCPGPPSCKSIPPVQTHCDLPGGRDISGNNFLDLFETFLHVSGQGDINSSIAAGKLGLIIYITDYNAAENDTQVGLAAFVSSGILTDPDGGSPIPPKWDGNDVWDIDPRSTGGVKETADGGFIYLPKFITTMGYVANRTLVAELSRIDLGLGAGTLSMTGAVFTASIVSDTSGGYRLQGQLAGRASTASILTSAAAFRDPIDKTKFLCGDDPTIQTYRKQICGAADLATDPAMDGKGAVCDAISMAIGFTALSAQLGVPAETLQPVLGCDGSVQLCP